jgi:DNA-binding transcriptional ArsR family regulator
MSNHSAAETALDALGDPMRRRLLELLHTGPRPVGELATQLPIGRPAVSKHLRVLEGAGLVQHRSKGTRNLYALAPDGLAGVQQWLVGVWDSTLTAFADYVDHVDIVDQVDIVETNKRKEADDD